MPTEHQRGPVDYFRDTGAALSDIGLAMSQSGRFGILLDGLNVKAPKDEGGEYLLVLRATDEEGAPVVSFTSATTLDECFRSAAARLRNGSMRWRLDAYRASG